MAGNHTKNLVDELRYKVDELRRNANELRAQADSFELAYFKLQSAIDRDNVEAAKEGSGQ